jgi:hypothetical protein
MKLVVPGVKTSNGLLCPHPAADSIVRTDTAF